MKGNMELITDEKYFEHYEYDDRPKDIRDYHKAHYIELKKPFIEFIEDRFIEKTPGKWPRIKENIDIYIDGYIDIMKKIFQGTIEKAKQKKPYTNCDFSKWHEEFETKRKKIKTSLHDILSEIETHINEKDIDNKIVENIKFKFEMLTLDIFGLEYHDRSGEPIDFSEYSMICDE
jgi:hypothetical protein